MRAVSPLLTLGAVVLVGCSMLPPTRTDKEASVDEVSELKSRVLELQRQAAKDQVEIARLRDQLAAAKAGGAPAPTSAGRPGTVEQRSHPVANSAARKPVGGESTATKTAPAPIESEDLKLSAPPAPQQPSGATEAITPEMQTLYDQGYTAFHERRYGDAESTFEQFLQRYPHSELADNASYWIGEARLQRQDTHGALAAFKSTVEKYPKGNKVPDALLKVGECLESLGDTDSARLSYQEVAKRFPNTAAAEVAKEREAQLK
jgi:tol-pal system protein YbgF